MAPPTAPTEGSTNGSTSSRSQCRLTAQSVSVNATSSPTLALIPALRPWLAPPGCVRRRRADPSAGAAAIHFAVMRTHFEEYFLFGVFFVLSGLTQLVWAILVVAWPRRWLLQLGAAGNASIAALWAVDRIWGAAARPRALGT